MSEVEEFLEDSWRMASRVLDDVKVGSLLAKPKEEKKKRKTK